MKLIDKDALVAEIGKRRKNWWYGSSIEAKYKREECDNILSLIDTLEVKEVDLEQEVKDFCERFDDRKEAWYNMTPHDQNLMVLPTFANFAMQLAKHFFELALSLKNS